MPSTRYLVPPPTPVEQLPPYSRRRDSDTSSIRSSAPSYVSEAPTYHSQVPPTHHRVLGSGPSPSRPSRPSRSQTSPPQEITGLPPISYAPGFHRAPSHSRSDLKHLSFNISEWSSAKNGPQARHYQAVANRRAKLASIEEKARLTNIASTMVFPSLASITSTESPDAVEENHNNGNSASNGNTVTSTSSANNSASVSSTPSTSTSTAPTPQSSTTPAPAPATSASTSTATATTPESTEPLSPLEDPELVGPAAAKAARERRLYMTRCLTESAALKQENASWDFMLGQMADWSERERSWDGFRRDVEGRSLLGNRVLRRIMPY